MQMSLTLAQQVLVMFLLSGIGYLMFRSGKITLEGNRSIGNILIYLSLPAVIIQGLMVDRTPQNDVALAVSALVGVGCVVLAALVARLTLRRDAIANFAATFSNPSFFGIPLVVSILGQGPVFYMTGFIAAMNVGQWTYGVSLLTGKPQRLGPGELLRSPFIIAVLVGLALYLTQPQLPGVVTSSLSFVAALNTPLAMFTIGVYLAHVDLRQMLRSLALYRVAAVRLLVIPLVTLALLSLLPAGYQDMRLAILVAQACPVGSNVAVYAQLHDCDFAYAVQTIVVSVLFSVVSIPLVVLVAQLAW